MRFARIGILAVLLGAFLVGPAAAQSISDDIQGGGGGQSMNLLKVGGKLIIKIAPAVVGVLVFLLGAAKGVKTGAWGEAFLTMGVGGLLVLAPPLIGYLAGWDLFNYFS